MDTKMLLVFLLWFGALFEPCKMEEKLWVEQTNRHIAVIEKVASIFTSEAVVNTIAKSTKAVTQILQIASSLTAVLGAAGPILSLVMGFVSMAMPQEDSVEAKLIKDLAKNMEIRFDQLELKLDKKYSDLLFHLLDKEYKDLRVKIDWLGGLHNSYMQSKLKNDAHDVSKELIRECEASVPEKYLQEVALRFNNENMGRIVEGLNYDITKFFNFTQYMVEDGMLAMKLFTACMAYKKVDNASFAIRDELATKRFASIRESLRFGQELIDKGWSNYLETDVIQCVKDYKLHDADHNSTAIITRHYLQNKYPDQEFLVISAEGKEFDVFGKNHKRVPVKSSKTIIVMWVRANLSCTFDKLNKGPTRRELVTETTNPPDNTCYDTERLQKEFFQAIKTGVNAPFNVTSVFVLKEGNAVPGHFVTSHDTDKNNAKFYKLIGAICRLHGRGNSFNPYRVYYVMMPACVDNTVRLNPK